MPAIGVFCGSSPGIDQRYAAEAEEVARLLVERGVRIVYGGAHVGTMGVLADTALAAGGEVVGVIPEHLVGREVAHPGLSELVVVGSMHERKALMAELSDGFVALPGGLGTLDEFAEIVTWSLLGLHDKPTAVFNRSGYFDQLLSFFDHAVAEGFLRPHHRARVLEARTLDEVVGLVLGAVGVNRRGDGRGTPR
ncbi:MAG TPA: TIGR00730 family Rossman fold protein [Acidimicrobiales bacterium]|nr:TIGR00730 family Rossman fold protein [Acidimicrobiales bacterium]